VLIDGSGRHEAVPFRSWLIIILDFSIRLHLGQQTSHRLQHDSPQCGIPATLEVRRALKLPPRRLPPTGALPRTRRPPNKPVGSSSHPSHKQNHTIIMVMLISNYVLVSPFDTSRAPARAPSMPVCSYSGYRPVQRGSRFSTNARAPSLASTDSRTGLTYSSCFSNWVSSGQSTERTSTCLDAARASGALAATSSASSSATSNALPGSVSRLTRWTSAASVAGHIFPVSTSSMARW